MHFDYLSFLLGVLSGIFFVCFLIYLFLKGITETEEILHRNQGLLDNYPEEFKRSHE